MPRFLPFQALLGHSNKGEELSDLVCPQFDELETPRRQELASKHRHNFIRFESRRLLPGEAPDHDRSARASGAYIEALSSNHIKRHGSNYYYMEVSNGDQKMTGFVGMFENAGKHRPSVFQTPLKDEIEDRLSQLSHLKLQTAPMTLGYRTTASGAHQLESIAHRASHHKPLLSFSVGPLKYRLWSVDSSVQLEPLLSKKSTVILDGAARLEASFAYQSLNKAIDKAPSPFRAYNFTMAWMVDMERNPVSFIPRHRAVMTGGIADKQKFLADLEDYFEIERYKLNTPGAKEAELTNLLDEMDCIGKLNHSYGLYIGDRALYLMYLRDADSYERLANIRKSRRWKRIDISILHSIIFDEMLSIIPEPNRVAAPMTAHQAIALVDDGFADAAFLLNGPPPDHLVDIAESAEPLPPRSALLAQRPLVGPIMASVSVDDYVGEGA